MDNKEYNEIFETEGYKFKKSFKLALEVCPEEVYDDIKEKQKKRPVTEEIFIEQQEIASCELCMKEKNCKNKGDTCEAFDFIFKLAKM